jgi:Fe2+ transport system protein B
MENVLNRVELLQQDTLKIEKVELPGKGTVYVREMTGKEKDVWEQSLMKQVQTGDKKNPVQYETSLEDFRAKLAVVTVCDEKGEIIFRPTDVVLLNKRMSASNLDRIVTVAQRLNRITEEDKEDILKNSTADQEKSSNSDSAKN